MSDICANTGRLCSRCQLGPCSFRREAKLKIKQLLDHCNTVCEKEVLWGGVCGSRYMEHDSVRVYLEELQRYKGLEEAGRLIELPCKVGDTVYIVGGKYRHGSFETWINTGKFNVEDLPKIGETVFLTKEEAEAKLEEMKGGE